MNLTEFINSHTKLTEAETNLLNKNIVYKKLKAKEYFLKSGERSNEIGFIVSGVFRYFFYDNEGNEITSFFMSENEFVGNVSSFFEYIPSSGNLQTVTDCEVFIISRSSWELFCKEIQHWESTFQKIINEVLIRKTNFQRSLINSDAQSSYLKFLNTYPTIAQRVPLNHIASFLGITPFSLSRIRKAIATL